MRLLSFSRRHAFLLGVVVLLFAAGAYAWFSAAGAGEGSATVGTATDFELSSGPVGTLYPGGPAVAVTIDIHNVGQGSQRLNGPITGTVLDNDGCLGSWFQVDDVDYNQTVAPGVTAQTETQVRLLESGSNQNACQGKTMTIEWSTGGGEELSFNVGARQTIVAASADYPDYPVWSSQDLLVYSAYAGPGSDLHTVQSDGTNDTTVLADSANNDYPRWAPNGQRFSFRASGATYSVRVRENNGTFHTVSSGVNNASPIGWSGDSSKVFFTGDVGENGNSAIEATIYWANEDGSGSPTAIGTLFIQNSGVADVSSATDRVAFTCEGSGGAANICVMDQDGSNSATVKTFVYGDVLGDLKWSADGTRIAYSLWPQGSDFFTDRELHVMDADGSNDDTLAIGLSAGGSNLSWAPDGSAIAYVKLVGTSINEIWVINSDGTQETNVSQTPEDEDAYSPTWSPDSMTIAYSSYDYPDYNGSGVFKRQVR